nr:monothiol glutaredoxin-7 [Quercus suber]
MLTATYRIIDQNSKSVCYNMKKPGLDVQQVELPPHCKVTAPYSMNICTVTVICPRAVANRRPGNPSHGPWTAPIRHSLHASTLPDSETRPTSSSPELPRHSINLIDQPATMPSSRRLKITGFVVILTILIILYITNGASNTHDSPFYTRTVAALKQKEEAAARQERLANEKQRLDRVEKIQKEHDRAVADAPPIAVAKPEGQKPLVADEIDPITGQKGADKVKPVAGRKTMKDDRPYPGKATEGDHDGVARVGNVEPKVTNLKTSEDDPKKVAQTEEERIVEAELNDILKKGPIVIFSKSYCPYSKKAKHILLDLYTITPKPHVVELDSHPLGAGLQDALKTSTGRRTVPNILINGRTIGGGDDVQKLHEDGKLIDLVQSMGGRRVTAVAGGTSSGQSGDSAAKKGLKFKA